MLKTRMTELLDIDYPIQCGTMQWISRAELVAAVANAGGLACLAAAIFETPQELTKEIRRTRELTDRPFGVGVGFWPTLTSRDLEETFQTVIDEGVKIVETSGRNPEPFRRQIVNGGLIHIHKCARLRDAAKMSRIGVDAVSVVGFECGGHPGVEAVSTMVLAPLVKDVVSVPLIVGGGICDGRSLMAALALGADGVLMGTRFINTKECTVHLKIKERFEKAAETETVLYLATLNNPGRVLRNAWAEKVVEMEKAGATLEELAPLISGQIARKGLMEGNVDEGLYYCGQVVGRVEDTPSVAELMKRIIGEAVEVKERLNNFYTRKT